MIAIGLIGAVLLGALTIYFAATRVRYTNLRDVGKWAQEAEDVVRRLPPAFIKKPSPYQATTMGAVGVLHLASKFAVVEMRRRVSNNLFQIGVKCAKIEKRIRNRPSNYARAAVEEVRDWLEQADFDYGSDDLRGLEDVHRQSSKLLLQMDREKPRLFKLSRLLENVQDLHKRATACCDDSNLQDALAKLGQRIEDLSRAQVSFSKPKIRRAIEKELMQAKDLLESCAQDARGPQDAGPSNKEDQWSVLGLSRGASEGEIKSAYRRKIAVFHPDKVEARVAALSDDPEVQQQLREWFNAQAVKINQAYETLTKGAKP